MAAAPSTATPAPAPARLGVVPNITLNMSEYCRLTGGTIDPAAPVLCIEPSALVPDRASCYAGPNNAAWVEGRGCVSNLVNACIGLNTFRSWQYRGNDVLCTWDFYADECSAAASQGGLRAERSADSDENDRAKGAKQP